MDAKTIMFDTFNNNLFLFKDTRPEAKAYVDEVLPTLIHGPLTSEDIMKAYNTLEGMWFEFDFTTNTLYLCSTKKIKT